jgi:hypothetical protein
MVNPFVMAIEVLVVVVALYSEHVEYLFLITEVWVSSLICSAKISLNIMQPGPVRTS